MLVAESDLKLLSSVLVLLWPFCVVFPAVVVSTGVCLMIFSKDILHDLTLLDDPLDFRDQDGANAHFRPC